MATFTASRDSREILHLQELTMSSANDNELRALLSRKEIVNLVKSLSAIGDEINDSYNDSNYRRLLAFAKSGEQNNLDKIWKGIGKVKDCFCKVVSVVDTVLEWLEHTSRHVIDDLQKQEGVLRGLTQLADLGNQVGLVAIVRLACSYLDVPTDPFVAERLFIKKCVDAIDAQQDVILQEVQQASNLLREIIYLPEWNRQKALAFDNCVREACSAIVSCKKRLDGADAKITELLFKINYVKWFHRGLRFMGAGISCYYIYERYTNGGVSLPVALGAGTLSAIGWMALFPSRTYDLYTELKKMQTMHKNLDDGLNDLAAKLRSTSCYKKKVQVEMAN